MPIYSLLRECGFTAIAIIHLNSFISLCGNVSAICTHFKSTRLMSGAKHVNEFHAFLMALCTVCITRHRTTYFSKMALKLYSKDEQTRFSLSKGIMISCGAMKKILRQCTVVVIPVVVHCTCCPARDSTFFAFYPLSRYTAENHPRAFLQSVHFHLYTNLQLLWQLFVFEFLIL